MSKRDYYDVLGLKKGADKKEIKKAYRRLAKQWHPDRNDSPEAEDKFKELQEAYEVLADDQKRAAYDQFGHAGTQGFGQGGGGFGGFDFGGGGIEDILNQFFGGAGGGFGFGGAGRGGNRRNRGRDIELNLKLSFEEAVFGGEKEIKYKRNVHCHSCDGTGAEGGDLKTCETCKGQGQVLTTQRTMFGHVQVAAVCPECHGEGRIPESKCNECNGNGLEEKDDVFKMKIPPAIPDGVTMRFGGRGNAGAKGGDFGDLLLSIEVEMHDVFERRGDDIYMDYKIDVVTAVLGGNVEIPTVHGDVTIKIDPGTQPEKVLRLSGKGGPKFKSPKQNGDQYIRLQVVIPQKLSKEQQAAWQTLQQIGPGEEKKNLFD